MVGILISQSCAISSTLANYDSRIFDGQGRIEVHLSATSDRSFFSSSSRAFRTVVRQGRGVLSVFIIISS